MGELRTLPDDRSGAEVATSLWAVVLDEDPIGRRLWFRIDVFHVTPDPDARPVLIAVDGMIEITEDLAVELRDHIFAVQGG
jgi:hypothetical protein